MTTQEDGFDSQYEPKDDLEGKGQLERTVYYLTENIIKVFISRIEESAVHYHIHKSDVWFQVLEKTKKSLLQAFKEQQNELEQQYKKGYAMAKFDCASELLNGENDIRTLIDEWTETALRINKSQ